MGSREASEVFVDRQEELAFLERLYQSFLRGLCCGVIVYGLRRVGKTTLIERFLRDKPSVSLNCAYVSSARAFYVELLSALASAFSAEDFKMRHTAVLQSLSSEREVLLRALELPVLLAEERRVKFCLFLDEFHLFLDKVCVRIAREERTSRDRVKLSVLWFLKSLAEKKLVFWIIASSLAWEKLLEEFQLRSHESPLLGVFERLEVKPLSREHAMKLALLANPELDESQAEAIAEISGGVPRIVLTLAHRLRKGSLVTREAIRLVAEGEFDDFFDNLIRFASEVTKYDYATLCHVLKPLAEGAKTSKEIAQHCGMERQVVHAILNELVKIGLLKKSEGRPVTFDFNYPLLGAWVLMRTRPTAEPKIKKLADLLGLTAESYVRELLREAVGREVTLWDDSRGTFFCGTTEKLTLRLRRVMSRRETIELLAEVKNADILAAQDDELLVFEVKSGVSPLTATDVIKLAEVRDLLAAKTRKIARAILVYMGVGTIELSAVAQAMRRGVIIMTREAVRLLAKKLDFPTL